MGRVLRSGAGCGLGGGVTVGVLGGALDRFFPKANTKLAREIVDAGGAVISEFPFGRSPDTQTFPQRNRVVSGLSCGVVAVEAPPQSGTLITCRLAGEQGRSVMAVPGRIDCRSALGCLGLIREGARLVTSVDDILEEIQPLGGARPAQKAEATPPDAPKPAHVRRAASAAKSRVAPKPATGALTLEEAMVLRAVPEAGAALDAVVRAAGLPAGKVNTLLVQLRLKRRVRFLPGNRVAPA